VKTRCGEWGGTSFAEGVFEYSPDYSGYRATPGADSGQLALPDSTASTYEARGLQGSTSNSPIVRASTPIMGPIVVFKHSHSSASFLVT
jgi:hypothetical protein